MDILIQRINDAFHMRATNEDGQSLEMDATPDIGGEGKGMRPMQVVLSALGGCSSIDVIHILRKQRQPLQDFSVKLHAERVDSIPKVFKEIHVEYILTGALDPAKVEKAISLSMEKYCSVTKMLEPTVNITWSYKILAGVVEG